MSHQASRDLRPKTKKELRREAIQRSKNGDDDRTSESSSYFLIPDRLYDDHRNMFDHMPGGLM